MSTRIRWVWTPEAIVKVPPYRHPPDFNGYCSCKLGSQCDDWGTLPPPMTPDDWARLRAAIADERRAQP